MRLIFAIIAFTLAAACLLWAALYASLIAFYLFQQRGGGWAAALEALSREIDLQRLALAATALGLGLAFLMLGTMLRRSKF